MQCVNQKAPDFTLSGIVGADIRPFTLKKLNAKWLVLFFYPKDFTFICPTEALGFNKLYDEFLTLGAEKMGISAGSYLSSKAQKEIFEKELKDQEKFVEGEPYLEKEGLLDTLSAGWSGLFLSDL